MSAAAATSADAGAAPPAKKKGKKKLIIIVAVVLLLLAVAGGAAALFLKKKAATDAEGGEESTSTSASAGHSAKPDLKHPPTFLPLDPFIVNLADADTDRYAQIGITLEVEDAHYGDEMKAFMPAIRNGILMILSHKTSSELRDRSGKELLAAEILREVSRTMGIDVEEPDAHAAEKGKGSANDKEAAGEDDEPKPKKAKAKSKPAAEPNPIKHVHFSNFIVQ